jgi:hypothetical protein
MDAAFLNCIPFQNAQLPQFNIKTLSDGDDYASLGISDNVNLVETLLKRLIQHYAIE